MASFDTKRSVALLKRKLFRSPIVDIGYYERSQELSGGTALLIRLQMEHDVIEVSQTMLQKEVHEERITQLRQKLKTLTEDDWQYPNVDKLIGLQ